MAVIRNVTTQTTIQTPERIGGSEYVIRFVASLLVSAIVMLLLSISANVACVSNDWSGLFCDYSGLVGLIGGIGVGLVLVVHLIYRPVKTRSDVEHKTEKLKFADVNTTVRRQHREAEIELDDKEDRLRIERKGEEADIDIRVAGAKATVKLIESLAAGVEKGTVDPIYFMHVRQIVTGQGRQTNAPLIKASANAQPQGEVEADITNTSDFKLVSVGGSDSPVKGKDIRAEYLTCSLRSLRAAVQLAEEGRQPTRNGFKAAGIKASEEATDCQKFLQDCGIMDANSGWGTWADGLDPRRFGRWIAWVCEVVERNGGEAIHRKAARKALGLPEQENGLSWRTPSEDVGGVI